MGVWLIKKMYLLAKILLCKNSYYDSLYSRQTRNATASQTAISTITPKTTQTHLPNSKQTTNNFNLTTALNYFVISKSSSKNYHRSIFLTDIF
jgi:hypothetical protein